MTKQPSKGAQVEVARVLRARHDVLLARWCDAVLADPRVPAAERLTRPALVDHMPEFVSGLASFLDGNVVPQSLLFPAKEHAAQRTTP